MSSFCICKSYSHFFSKNTCKLDIVLTRTVKILTTNELVKLTVLWTTGPWLLSAAFVIGFCGKLHHKKELYAQNRYWSSKILVLSKGKLSYSDNNHFPIECKVHKCLPPKFDFSAEMQKFIEYFYQYLFNFSADFQKINAKIPFTPSYLELCLMNKYMYICIYGLFNP